jgi:hypothetical protein
MKAPKGVADFGNPPKTVGLARAAAHRRGGELLRWLGFNALMSKILADGGSFYMGF